MKKLLLLVAVLFVATTSFAQEWSVGGRIGSGFQALGQYNYNSSSYVEARFGMSWNNPKFTTVLTNGDGIINDVRESRVMAEFAILHNWHVLDMDWTPRAGMWFFDAGVGVGVGGRSHYAYVGVAGLLRLGFEFNNAPVTIAVDYSPIIGTATHYGKHYSNTAFNDLGMANLGISCTYNF